MSHKCSGSLHHEPAVEVKRSNLQLYSLTTQSHISIARLRH